MELQECGRKGPRTVGEEERDWGKSTVKVFVRWWEEGKWEKYERKMARDWELQSKGEICKPTILF